MINNCPRHTFRVGQTQSMTVKYVRNVCTSKTHNNRCETTAPPFVQVAGGFGFGQHGSLKPCLRTLTAAKRSQATKCWLYSQSTTSPPPEQPIRVLRCCIEFIMTPLRERCSAGSRLGRKGRMNCQSWFQNHYSPNLYHINCVFNISECTGALYCLVGWIR